MSDTKTIALAKAICEAFGLASSWEACHGDRKDEYIRVARRLIVSGWRKVEKSDGR